MIVSRLMLVGNEKTEVVLVCFDLVCVFSSPTVLPPLNSPLLPLFPNDIASYLIILIICILFLCFSSSPVLYCGCALCNMNMAPSLHAVP